MPRLLVSRFVAHVALTLAVTLVAVPALRVLCFDSCAPSVASAAVEVAPTPECHEAQDTPHSSHESDSVPGPEDCRHGGDSSARELRAQVKSTAGDGPRVAVTQHITEAQLLVGTLVAPRDTPKSTAQVLGLFLTPLRI